ncbi:MAG TPA: LD-carboxypeptidase [Tepidisphaeraceae bacterium]|nr:LD-carboxypeptidase [Tepidisphaeraceae bacterium]
MSDGAAKIRVGIFAASSAVPIFEFERGLQHLRSAGFVPIVHEQVAKQHFTFAGTDQQRASAFYEYAVNPMLPVLWAARGGYGTARLLPLLEELSARHGIPPKKLLVGYSDLTVLHEFVRTRWGWSTLHAPMPAAANFATFDAAEFHALVAYVRKQSADALWAHKSLTWLTEPPAAPIRAQLIGGNLALWQTLAGTPWQPSALGRILFFEDLGEPYYRIDRMVTHLAQSRMLDGAAAIVLGDFCNCADEDTQCWANAQGTEKKSLRRTFNEREAFDEIFGSVGRRLRIPIADGLPVGHGPHFAPLPLGAGYELGSDGTLKLVNWDWLF